MGNVDRPTSIETHHYVYEKAGYEVESGSCDSSFDAGYSDSLASTPMEIYVSWQKKQDGSTIGPVSFEYDPRNE